MNDHLARIKKLTKKKAMNLIFGWVKTGAIETQEFIALIDAVKEK